MLKKTSILLLIALFLTIHISSGQKKAPHSIKIQKQFIEYFNTTIPNDSIVEKLYKELQSNGTWSYINYESKRRGSWEVLTHLEQLLLMTKAYANPKSKHYQNTEILGAIKKGINHWLEKDYTNPNWWTKKIGVPENMLKIFILLDNNLPKTMLKKAQKHVLKRSKMGMTGQNKVWLAGISFMKSYLTNDEDAMEIAIKAIWSELHVSTKEGIQPDWSFHQHGPQQQFGNYGRSFGESMVFWAYALRGTKFSPNEDQLKILRNYLTQGSAWVLWKNQMDLSSCGRQFTIDTPGNPRKNFDDIQSQMSLMIDIDKKNKALYKKPFAKKNKIVGHKSFWRTDMAVHRSENWYASIKMSSTRVIGSETANSENTKGIHQGDGTLLLYQSGKEYEDIAPIWDWHRLPGTTCDQGMHNLMPKGWNKSYGASDFAGVIHSDKKGIATMHYKRNKLSAQKAYFFIENTITCLGTNIEGETQGNVYTSIQQSHLQGQVNTSSTTLSKGTHYLKAGTWVQHDNIAYHLLDNTICNIEDVEGNWLSCYPKFSDRPVKGTLFNLWIDHGKSPKAKKYAYQIFPEMALKNIEHKIKKNKTKVESNTNTVQAISYKDDIYAVFYKAGLLKTEKLLIEVDAPCLLILNKKQIIISDPIHKTSISTIKINKKEYKIIFPKGDLKGDQLSVNLE